MNCRNHYAKYKPMKIKPIRKMQKTLPASEQEIFERAVLSWYKGKTFADAVRGVSRFIYNDDIRNILASLEQHQNVMKAYKHLSRLFHPDRMNNRRDLSDLDKFKYVTIMKALNGAK